MATLAEVKKVVSHKDAPVARFYGRPKNAPGPSDLELALAEAYKIAPGATMEQARARVQKARDRLETLLADTWAEWWTPSTRNALVERDQATAELAYLEAFAAGKPVPLEEPASVDAELVAAWGAVRDKGRVAQLLARLADVAYSKEEALRIHGRLEGFRSELKAGNCTLQDFTQHVGALHAELAEGERRRDDLLAARTAVLEALRAIVPDALEALPAVRSGLREATALGRSQDAALAAMVRELDEIDGTLSRIILDDGVNDEEEGKVAAALKARRREISDAIAARRQERAGAIKDEAADILARAVDGDAEALATLHSVIGSRPDAFEPGLAGRLAVAIGQGLAAGGSTIASMID